MNYDKEVPRRQGVFKRNGLKNRLEGEGNAKIQDKKTTGDKEVQATLKGPTYNCLQMTIF